MEQLILVIITLISPAIGHAIIHLAPEELRQIKKGLKISAALISAIIIIRWFLMMISINSIRGYADRFMTAYYGATLLFLLGLVLGSLILKEEEAKKIEEKSIPAQMNFLLKTIWKSLICGAVISAFMVIELYL